jgi:hypothetical protein
VLLGASLASWSGSVFGQEAASGTKITLVMEDQFGQVHRLEDYKGDVLILVYSDREGAEASLALGRQLHLLFHPAARGLPPAQASKAPTAPIPGWPEKVRQPEVKVQAVACIANLSGRGFAPLRSYIQRRFREEAPDVPVWLDMGDQLKSQCGLQAGVPNVVVFDTASRLRYRKAGPWQQPQIQELERLVLALRREVLTGQAQSQTAPPADR